MTGRSGVAYKVLTAGQYARLCGEGVFAGAPVDLRDGFVHLSTAEQLGRTIEKHFAGQAGLHVVAVDLAALSDAVRWEPSRGGDLFPHLYAPMPMTAVLAASPLTYAADGAVRVPSADGCHDG